MGGGVKQAETKNSHEPTVSVCIANYNGLGLIDECINSVRNQDCGFSVEIVVHDDASTDGSVQHILATYPEVVLIKSTENVGFCVANNRMAAAAQGKFLLLLNNDAALFSDSLRMLHQESVHLGSPAILGLPQYNHDGGELIDYGCLLDPFYNPVPNLDPFRKHVAMVIGACMWIPKGLWDELGGFPEWFGSLAEDMYFCCCTRMMGYPVLVLNQSGYRHQVGRSLGGGKITSEKRLVTSLRRRSLSERNKTFVMILTNPTPLLLVVLPIHLLVLAIEGILLLLIKRDYRLWHEVYVRSYTSLWHEFKHLKATRTVVQVRRKISLIRWLSEFTILPHKLRLLMRHGLPEVER